MLGEGLGHLLLGPQALQHHPVQAGVTGSATQALAPIGMACQTGAKSSGGWRSTSFSAR